MDRAESVPSPAAIRRLNELATKELSKIMESDLSMYEESELISAKALLDRTRDAA